jgi:DNA polymerase-4
MSPRSSGIKTTWDTPVLHADLDAFYASVEVLRDPGLAGKPVIVGGTSTRGVVTSASYEARRYGVTSAMPTSRARRLCPDGIFISPDFTAYTEKSKEVREVFDSFSPIVEPLSLDEAFLDLCGASRMWPSPLKYAKALREEVKGHSGLVVSVGVAPNKFLAKLASVKAKPNGLIVVEPNDVEGFLHPLRTDHLWGVGQQTTQILDRLGLKTVGDIASVPKETLERALGSLGSHISRLAQGKDERRVVADPGRKQLGSEQTFERDLVLFDEWAKVLLSIADGVSSRLRSQGISGQTVTLKVRFSNFTTITRSRTLPADVDSAITIYRVARELLIKALGPHDPGRRRLRLLGISVSGLKDWPPSEQLTFDSSPRWQSAEEALDIVRDRFGESAVGFGALLEQR